MSLSVFVLATMFGLGAVFVIRAIRPAPPRVPIPVPARGPGALGPDVGPDASQEEPTALRYATRRAAMRVSQDLGKQKLLAEDATMIGRSLETHGLMKLGGLVAGAVVTALLATVFGSLVGYSVPLLIVVALAAGGALLGWWLPDSMLRTEAEKERVYFQQAAESWLELVAQLVTAGSDTFAALMTAATYSEQPVFVTIRDSLRWAAVSGNPPWEGLRMMAEDRRLRFLDPFCSALELAGTTGAGSRQAILSQVDAARSKALHAADAAAASSSEKMGAPLALIGGAFMILMGYPPLAGIMNSGNVSGL